MHLCQEVFASLILWQADYQTGMAAPGEADKPAAGSHVFPLAPRAVRGFSGLSFSTSVFYLDLK